MYFLLIALAAFGCGAAEIESRLDLMKYCLVKKGRLLQEGSTCSGLPGKEMVLDLGTGHYPRFLSTFECDAIACHPFFCSNFTYNVRVLRRREVGDILDQTLPDALKYNWKFVNIPVNVGCTCNGNIS